jgi:MoxR-like ATPase
MPRRLEEIASGRPHHREQRFMDSVQAAAQRIVDNVERVIVGKHDEVQLTLIALLCQGHVLIDDVPGVGKTMLAKAFAKSLGCSFKRIQFTPDMLPSDVTGVSVFDQSTGRFEFRAGPVMANVVLTDEINRATPKTQSALLEAMEEHQVTVDGVTHPLERPFIVLATQNPIEYEGTFPLPEAQLDRFLMRISLGYPSPVDEIRILEAQQYVHPIQSVDRVVDASELVEMQESIKAVYVHDAIKEYIVSLVGATRGHPDVYLGSSPRGALALHRTSQARSALLGRDYVIPDDVKVLAEPTLAHRLIVNPAAKIREIDPRTVIKELLQAVEAPGAPVQEQR